MLTYGGSNENWTDELNFFCDSDGASQAAISRHVVTLGGEAIAGDYGSSFNCRSRIYVLLTPPNKSFGIIPHLLSPF